MSADRPLFPLRTVVVGTFLPTVLMEIAISAVAPIIVATATGMGATLALAGILTALPAIGQIASDLPAGAFAARMGDRGAMIAAAVVAVLAFAGAALAPGLWALGAALVASGAAAAVFNLARHSYLTGVTPPLGRGRVLTTLAGVHRIGAFIGPFLGAAVVTLGGVGAVYVLAAVASVAALVVLLAVGPDDTSPEARAAVRRLRRHGEEGGPRMIDVLRGGRRVLATLGIAVLLMGAARGARATVLPLWGEHLGFDPATVSLVVGVSAAIDMVIFYPSGMVMDAYGRMFTGIPGALGLGVSLLLLPFTGAVWTFTVVAVLLGIANGWSSGILMTLGADTAPERGRSQYLGAWRVLQDSGGAIGPLLVSAVAGLGSLAAGIWIAALTGFGAAAAMWRWIPAFSPHATNDAREAAGLPRGRPRRRRSR